MFVKIKQEKRRISKFRPGTIRTVLTKKLEKKNSKC
jgi:hypothetical protein